MPESAYNGVMQLMGALTATAKVADAMAAAEKLDEASEAVAVGMGLISELRTRPHAEAKIEMAEQLEEMFKRIVAFREAKMAAQAE